jgi:hypothetical protein
MRALILGKLVATLKAILPNDTSDCHIVAVSVVGGVGA